MKLLKKTEEYRVESDVEARQMIDDCRTEAIEKGYAIAAAGYTHKEKKMKGEIIDSCEIVKIVKVFGGIWE